MDCCQEGPRKSFVVPFNKTVGLALFFNELSVADKLKIVDRMTTEPVEQNVRGNAMILIEEVCLEDFGTCSLPLRLKIGESFLTLPPETWC